MSVSGLVIILCLLGEAIFWIASACARAGAGEPARPPVKPPTRSLASRPASSASPTPVFAPRKDQPKYDEEGIRAKRVELENRGLELYRNPAGTYTFNVGVHSMFIYSVTQCLPIEKDLELRLNLKQWMPQHRADGQEVINVSDGHARTAGTVSIFFAF